MATQEHFLGNIKGPPGDGGPSVAGDPLYGSTGHHQANVYAEFSDAGAKGAGSGGIFELWVESSADGRTVFSSALITVTRGVGSGGMHTVTNVTVLSAATADLYDVYIDTVDISSESGVTNVSFTVFVNYLPGPFICGIRALGSTAWTLTKGQSGLPVVGTLPANKQGVSNTGGFFRANGTAI